MTSLKQVKLPTLVCVGVRVCVLTVQTMCAANVSKRTSPSQIHTANISHPPPLPPPPIKNTCCRLPHYPGSGDFESSLASHSLLKNMLIMFTLSFEARSFFFPSLGTAQGPSSPMQGLKSGRQTTADLVNVHRRARYQWRNLQLCNHLSYFSH